jgi:hypothetical protein
MAFAGFPLSFRLRQLSGKVIGEHTDFGFNAG